MVTTRKKLSAPAAKKTAAKKTTAKKAAVKKAVVKKAAPKKAAPKKAAPKKVVKKTAKKIAKKVVKKTAAGANATSPRAGGGASPVKAAPKKASIKKTAAKKTVKTVAKPVAKKAAGATHASPVKAVKTPALKPHDVVVTPKPSRPSPAPTAPVAQKTPAPAQPPISLKGLKGVSGAKAARIAQIVAESFLNKAAVAPEAAQPEASSHTATTDVSVASAENSGEALEAAHKAAAVLFSKKAEDVVLMDLRNLSTVADYYLIATCLNEPQMRAILGTVQRALSREGIKSLRSEYMPGVRWAVIDYGDLIVHLFEKQTRGFYSLERLWADAPSTTLKAGDYSLPEEADADEDGDL